MKMLQRKMIKKIPVSWVVALSVMGFGCGGILGQTAESKIFPGRWLRYRGPVIKARVSKKRSNSITFIDFTLFPSLRGPCKLVFYFEKGDGFRIKKIEIPFSSPGGFIWRKKPESLILCGWDRKGLGKVIEVRLDFRGSYKDFSSFEKELDKKEKSIVSWTVEFEKRVFDVTWGPSKKKIFILMEDGGILYAENEAHFLTKDDFKALLWKGGYPSKILGDPYDLKIESGIWAGWPYGAKARLLLRKWSQPTSDMLVFPKKYFVLGMEGGKVWIDGVWENPATKNLRFLGLPLKEGERSLCVSGVKGEPFHVYSFEDGRKVLVGKGRIGDKGIFEIDVPSGLRLGSPYWIVGPPYRVSGNFGTISVPVLVGGKGFCARNIEVSEWCPPLPEKVYAGSQYVGCEIKYATKGINQSKGINVFVLIGPQVKKNSNPLMDLGGGKTIVRPWWIGEMKISLLRKGFLEGRIDFPAVPAGCKGLVFWIQAVLVAHGRLLSGTKPLGYSVLGEPKVPSKEDRVGKFAREGFLLGWVPPQGCEPMYSKTNHESLKSWLARDQRFRCFESPTAGLLWMRKKGKK